jgi:prepilin-type processing-associated H-X9-DG protein
MNCAVSGINLSRVKETSDIVLLIDEAKSNDGYFFAVDDTKSGNTISSTDALTKVHNGGGNLLFIDGHAKFFPFEKFALDDSAEGKANKWRDTGSPRFHDPAFGPFGSAGRPTTGTRDGSAIVPDYCNATKRDP